MAFDTTQLDALVKGIVTSEEALAVASSANDTAQSAAQEAIAAAAGTQQAKVTAHDALWQAIDDLKTYVETLKTP